MNAMTISSEHKYKILVLPYTHTLSHLSRTLAVGKALRERGAELAFGGQSPRTDLIEQEGFTVFPLAEPDPDLLFNNIRQGKLKFIDNGPIQKMMDDDLALLKSYRPDMVLSDGRFTAPMSSQAAGIPHAAIVNVSSTEYRALPYVPLLKTLNKRERHGKVMTMLRHFNLFLEMAVFNNSMPVFKKITKSKNLAAPVTATNCLAGANLTLLADIPEYFPSRRLPVNYHYIGPLTWKQGGSIPPPNWWPVDKKNRRLVYITMGTTGEVDFFPIVKKLVLSSEITAIMTTGGQVNGIEHVPGRFYVEQFIDGDLVAEACDLVICHGGNGTIYQALGQGKPVIGIPTLPDQSFNMRRVEALGVGENHSIQKICKITGLFAKNG